MHRENLTKWLKDAYSMERAAIEILEKQEKNLGDYPQVQKKIREHLEQSHWQSDQVESCLSRLDTKPSSFKNVTAKFNANLSAMINATAEDEVLKDMIADAAFEHMEIASYRSLITAAQESGEPEIARVCEEILRQEEDMARWVEEQIPALTKEFLMTHAAR